jgi:hypothetical protein
MGKASMRALALFAVAALAACSSGGGSGSGPTITSFTGTPNSLPTAGGSVTLAWVVTGASSLSIDHGVGAVTPLTSGNTAVQVTATTTFTLTATDSSGSSTQTAQVTVAAPITLSGTVTDEFGNPAPGQAVLITSGSFSQSTVSDANGAFSVPNVPTPYTATVVDSGGEMAIQYQGLTRSDPTLMDLVTVTAPHSATVSGQLSGGTFPETVGYATTLQFASSQTVLGGGGLSVNATSGAFTGTVKWAGATTTTGTLYALQVHSAAGLPADYPGYGTLANVLLQDMGTLAGQTVALSAVTASTLSGTVTAPTGYPITGKELLFIPASNAFVPIAEDSTASTTFSYTTPSIANTTLTFLAEAQGTLGDSTILKKTGLAANATGLSLSIPAPPLLSLPVDAATGVTLTTPFSWTGFTGVYLVFFRPSTTAPLFYVFTASSTVTIPDLTSAGLPLPPSTSYDWRVIGLGPTTSVDSMAVGGGLIGLLEFSDGYYSQTVQRAFTTGP